MTEFDALIRIITAVLLGALLGFEREVTSKPAGLRTHMLVTQGAALFMIASILIYEEYNPTVSAGVDPTRIGSTIVMGVGFLGAGMILRSGSRVIGLTTAAGIWVAAAIGMLIGAGFFTIGIIGTVFSVVTLFLLGKVEDKVPRMDPRDPEPEDEKR